MVTPGTLLVIVAAALLTLGGRATVHAVKKVSHQAGCVIHTGHRCPPKK